MNEPSGKKNLKETGAAAGKRLPARYIALIVLAAVAAVVLIVALIYRSWARQPELPGQNGQPPASAGPDGSASPTQPEEPEEFDGVQPYVTGDRKEKFYTFLIVGRDTAGGGNTDTVMVASYDAANQRAALMSIPRDTMVNASWDIKRINTVYNVNENSKAGSGVDALKRYVAGLIGFEPDFTVVVEWAAVGAIVDAIGGVYFDVPFDMYYEDWAQELWINQQAGYRLLSGADAMQIVRWRHNNCGVPNPKGTDGSDLGRTRLQQSFITAVLKQCLQIKNVGRVKEIAQVFTDYVETELTAGNLAWFAEQALLGGFSTENMYTCTMPIKGGYDVYCRSVKSYQNYVTPNGAGLVELVNEHLNPYEENVTLANLDIMSVNADGTISSSTGVVRDTGANPAVLALREEPPESGDPGGEDPSETDPEDPGQTGPGGEDPEQTAPGGGPQPGEDPEQGDPGAADPADSESPAEEGGEPAAPTEDIPLD